MPAGIAMRARRLLRPRPPVGRLVMAAAMLAVLVGGPITADAAAGSRTDGDAERADPIRRAVHDNPQRTDADRMRDRYRHPVETLRFFGIRPDMTIVELHPGGGWYTRILAPLVRERGRWIGAEYDPDLFPPDSRFRKAMEAFPERVRAQPGLFGANAGAGYVAKGDYAEPGTVDMILGIRFMHNWIRNGIADRALEAAYRALRPGGVLAIVQHRAGEDDDRDDLTLANNGYVKESTMIRMAVRHGFRLVAKSEINANPKDDRHHPRGVWTLPPTLALGDEGRERYLAIGESDRMTLKFVKPE